MSVKAIILLGGVGERFGSETPKQFIRLGGKPIYRHTLDAFLALDSIDEIICVCHKEFLIPEEPRVRVITGGASRRESSYLGLIACGNETEIVVIHDGVRPFVTKEIIEANIEGAKKYGAIDTCIPSADTIVCSNTGNEISTIPKRAQFMRGQTPQSFSYPLILDAHKNTRDEVTDDCSLVIKAGKPVHITLGSEENIKITTELDLTLAEQILRLRCTNILPTLSIKGKKIAVIGGHGGIGRAICTEIEKRGGCALPFSRKNNFDISKDTLQEEFDGLVVAAGRLQVNNIADLPNEEIEKQIAVNLTGLIRCVKETKLSPGGHIVTIASSSYSRGRAGYAVYSATKAAVVNFTQGLANERLDLRINCAIPGRTDTEMRRKNFGQTSSLLLPEEVGKSVVDLLECDVSGTTVEIKGNSI